MRQSALPQKDQWRNLLTNCKPVLRYLPQKDHAIYAKDCRADWGWVLVEHIPLEYVSEPGYEVVRGHCVSAFAVQIVEDGLGLKKGEFKLDQAKYSWARWKPAEFPDEARFLICKRNHPDAFAVTLVYGEY